MMQRFAGALLSLARTKQRKKARRLRVLGAGGRSRPDRGELGLGADLAQGEGSRSTKQRIERAALRLGAGRRRRPSTSPPRFSARDGRGGGSAAVEVGDDPFWPEARPWAVLAVPDDVGVAGRRLGIGGSCFGCPWRLAGSSP